MTTIRHTLVTSLVLVRRQADCANRFYRAGGMRTPSMVRVTVAVHEFNARRHETPPTAIRVFVASFVDGPAHPLTAPA